MKKILLIDGHSILFRAYYGVPALSDSSGRPTNAVYGFLNILFKVIEDEKPDLVAAAFDLKRQDLRRTKIYPDYKGNRKPVPEDLLIQEGLLFSVIEAMGIPAIRLQGYEADDILGTLAKRNQASGNDVTVISGDRDLLQLCDHNIRVLIPRTSKGKTEIHSYYPDDVRAEFGTTPEEFIDLKALMGDTSDNIPGLPGVGEKTAAAIISAYHSIENAYANVDGIRPPRAQKAFQEHYDLAVLSKKLATIDTDVPLRDSDVPVEADSIYTEAALEKIRELEFKTIASRFASKMSERHESEDNSGMFDLSGVKLTFDPYMARVIFKDAELEKIIGFHLFYENTDGADRAALALSLGHGRNYVIAAGTQYPFDDLINDTEKMLESVASNGICAATSGLKEQLLRLSVPESGNIADLSLASYLLYPLRNSYDIDDIAADFLSARPGALAELPPKKTVFQTLDDGMTRERAVKYMALYSSVPLLSLREAEKRLKAAGEDRLYHDVEMPLVYTLSSMERTGIRADRTALAELGERFSDELKELEAKIYSISGETFNINSPQQLGTVLFEKLGISGGKKTKTGYSTAADVLEKLSDRHPVIELILRYRTVMKLNGTYASGLQSYIGPDGRIHCSFNQTATATGRLSCTDPNLQNIPVRTEEGKEIRKVFIPEEGKVFVDADYSQVELRILAALSGDERLISAYGKETDIHTLTASQVFHVPIEDVTAEMRRNAKAVNFGIVYGISAFGLGEGLSISRKEAGEYIERYFETYPGVKRFLDDTVGEAKKNGYTVTAYGRRRPIPELSSSNFMQRSFGERAAMNSPIQGTAADIMKMAMNSVRLRLEGINPDGTAGAPMKSRIVLQVHDELLIEAVPSELASVKEILRDCMENTVDLPVSLKADIKEGYSWYECH